MVTERTAGPWSMSGAVGGERGYGCSLVDDLDS